MPDIVLDTNILADFLAQYFGIAERGRMEFIAQDTLNAPLTQRINQIVRWHQLDFPNEDVGYYPGRIIASTLAFVEMARKWTSIVRNRFEVIQLAAYVAQPPEWFVIEPIDENLLDMLCDVPASILASNGCEESIEWTDAVHVATALARGEDCVIAVTDRRIQRISLLRSRLI